MTYITPFAFLKQKYKINATSDLDRVVLSYRDFLEILRALLRGVNVDKDWYLSEHSDVEEAIKAGIFKSAKQHFLQNGYFEGRRPAYCEVDEDWYLLTYPDIASAIDAKLLTTATEHFHASGYEEGRLPREF